MTARDAATLTAAAALASAQSSTSRALTAAMDFLDRFPAASAAWEYTVHGTGGPSAALTLTVQHATPGEIAGTLRAAAHWEAAA